MKYLVTGAAGFIGSQISQRLLALGHTVIGIDNLNSYYDVALKQARLQQLADLPLFKFLKIDIAEQATMDKLFSHHQFTRVIHLAGQAGVRYSLENPRAYLDSNIIGFLNILEGCRHHKIDHLIYASSSSVYGLNQLMPFSPDDSIAHPVSLYAATKKSNELMAHSYSHLYQIPTTGLRFFTVYGPWGRPDMALFKFTKAILQGEPIDIYNYGQLSRDFTYIDDIVESIIRVQDYIPQVSTNTDRLKTPATSTAPYQVFNIGNGHPTLLLEFVEALEEELGISAKKNMLPMQPGDVHTTWADTEALEQAIGFHPNTTVKDGIRQFVSWYRSYYPVPPLEQRLKQTESHH